VAYILGLPVAMFLGSQWLCSWAPSGLCPWASQWPMSLGFPVAHVLRLPRGLCSYAPSGLCSYAPSGLCS